MRKLYELEGHDLQRFKKVLATYPAIIAKSQADDNKGYTAMLRGDLRDLTAVYRHIRDGRYAAALRIADKLDTAVKDEIPTRLFNAVWQAVRTAR